MEQLFKPSLYGRYVLLNKIAAGGMAEVFRAKSFGAEDFEKLIAIKRLHPHLCEDASFIKMFINEAKLAATLNHVNVAPIYDFGRQENLYYIAMEYVRGCDLADLIERCRQYQQALPLGLAIWLLIEICNGLDYAHRKHNDLGNFLNLIHRDITPQNILLSYEGEVKIADFGIAKVQMLERDETTGGILKGKFSYMSPEQVRGERMDHRSDIFSLGIVAWELLTCQKMFDGPNDYHILEKVREALFIPPRQINPEIPPALEQIVMKCLTRSPEERYGSVGELRLALLRLLSSSRLFPSRAHLSAFVRKLFQEKLQKEQEEIIRETESARLIWNEHRGHISHSETHISSPMLPALSPYPSPNASVEVLAVAPSFAPIERASSFLLNADKAPMKVDEEATFPLASLPEKVDVDMDEDPTLPDISETQSAPIQNTEQRSSQRRRPLKRPLGPSAPPSQQEEFRPTAPPLDIHSSTEWEPETYFTPPARRNWSLIIGVSTFLLGLSFVLLFSQYVLPQAQTNTPSKQLSTPTLSTLRSPTKQTVHTSKPFAPAKLIIHARPWARIYLNGQLLSRTPINQQIAPGTYQVTALFPNLSKGLKFVRKTYNIKAKAGKTLKLWVRPQ